MKLYMRGRYFLCRACHRLAYQSQSEGVADRTMRRADEIRVRLGGELGAMRSFPPRPKGMWRGTHTRLFEDAHAAEDVAPRALTEGLERCLGRLPHRG